MRGVEYYRQKYGLGLVDIENSLQKYEEFLSNLGEEKSLAEGIQQQLHSKKKLRILDIGCGNAGALKELKKKFGEKIETIGLDLIPFPEKNTDQQIAGNALEKKLPDNCDLIVSFRALHEIGHSDELVPRICEALASKGIALLAFRLHSIVNNSIEWAGDMQETDEHLLLQIAEKKRFVGCMVSGKMAFETLSNGERTPTGIFIKIKKEH